MNNKVDLHIHTTASDGSDSPRVLSGNIKKAGIGLFSVTDHDTISGAMAMEPLVPEGVRFVRGIEFSCADPAGKCHILGYGYDPDHPAFRAALAEGRQLRLAKMALRIEALARDHGVVLTDGELQWVMGHESPGKPHLGKVLMDRGLAPTLDRAIQGYLRDVPGRDRIDAKTAVEAITAAGGFPVWAHPLGGEGEKRLTPERFSRLLQVLLGYGIRGMECWYSRYSMADVGFLLEQADRHGLTVTGGSDYHGTNKQDLPLGRLNTDGTPWTVDTDALYGIICK
ncbi:MAG: PHP domain-containing protein [Oscillospiraceae bacterium]|nr:PHP domain-containing protein [Oscillospiraceae bacterium]